jgi:hypothetical protein
MAHPLIWFVLLDSSTIDQNPSVSSILRSNIIVPVVDQFRDAVKAKYSESLLKGIAPSELVVYRNRAAIIGREAALKSSDSIDDLGKSEQDALIVIIEEARSRKRKAKEHHRQGEKYVKFATAFSSSSFSEMHESPIKFASWSTRSDFEDIRTSGIPYIDKTRMIYELTGIGHVFLSRPRRFGKTLLVNTLKHLYLGSKDLFKGLDIEYPVIHLDFSSDFPERFGESLVTDLIRVGREYGISFDHVDQLSLGAVFKHLVDTFRALNATEGKKATFVILIDEYDKPVLDCLDNTELVQKILYILSIFFQMVKSQKPKAYIQPYYWIVKACTFLGIQWG